MNQNGRGPQLYGSLETYTLQKPEKWHQPAIGEYRVFAEAKEYNLGTRVPFDTNWGRSDFVDILPLQAYKQANSDTWQNPGAVPLDSQYRPLAYETWDPMRPAYSIQRRDDRVPRWSINNE